MDKLSNGATSFAKLLWFLENLKDKKIYFNLDYIREGSILVYVCVPGQRWEVEFFESGSIEIERFLSNDGVDDDENLLNELFDKFSN